MFLLLLTVHARRWNGGFGRAIPLAVAVVFVLALACLSVVASSAETNMSALVLGAFVVFALYRAEPRFYIATVTGAIGFFVAASSSSGIGCSL